MKADPINESLSLELDMINILCVVAFERYVILWLTTSNSFSIRLVQILSMQSNSRK